MELHELPVEFMCETVLRKIGSCLGTVIKIDMRSIDVNKLRFVRILTIMDISVRRKEFIWLGSFKQTISYKDWPVCAKSVIV